MRISVPLWAGLAWRERRRATAYAVRQAWVCTVWPALQLGRWLPASAHIGMAYPRRCGAPVSDNAKAALDGPVR